MTKAIFNQNVGLFFLFMKLDICIFAKLKKHKSSDYFYTLTYLWLLFYCSFTFHQVPNTAIILVKK